MTIVARDRVNADVKAAIDCYLDEDAMNAAMNFIDASERSYAHIGRYTAPVSSRYARELNLPRLRAWKLTRYLYRASIDVTERRAVPSNIVTAHVLKSGNS